MSEPLKTVFAETIAELEEKRSRFIARLVPVEDEGAAAVVIAAVRKRYKDANHNCFAYRVLENGVERQRYNDDGEPSGTAGMPILNVIKANGLVNCVVIVTRYFGGVLLGAGGLVRAYGGAASLAVKQAEINGNIAEIKRYSQATVSVTYGIADKVLRAIENAAENYEVTDKQYCENVVFTVLVEERHVNGFEELIIQISNGQATVVYNRP